jgi:hypothetical protein
MGRRHVGVVGAASVALLASVQLGALVAAPHGGGWETEPGIAAYEGHGTWVDVYDFVPSYQAGGAPPPLDPEDLDAMADAGVRTLYLQAAHANPRTPGLLADDELLERFLVRAHERGLRVVGWYLPRFDDIDRDLAHLDAIARFEVDGHRFDGVAVDIEWTESVPDHAARSDRLVELSRRAREVVADGGFGAIVMPPVQTEVVNPAFWPGFPWDELAPLYDVWLPMSYWTDRRADSGYRDGARYTADNVARLRANVGDDAVVHAIGGIGHEATPDDLRRFVAALAPTGAIGGSVYDWDSLDEAKRQHVARAFGG